MIRAIGRTMFKGPLIVMPLLFLLIVIEELVVLLITLATPIADALFTEEFIERFPSVELLAFLLIAGASLLLGILALVPPVAAIGRWFETRLLEKIPVYTPLKAFLYALLGSEQSQAFKPAFVHHEDGSLEPAYVVEDTGRDRVIVLIPWSPTSFAGSLKLLPRESVHLVDLSFDEFSLKVSHFGVGMTDMFPEVPEGLKMKKRPGADQVGE